MSVTEVAHLIETDHAVVFLKTSDGEMHALEFGKHHGKAAQGSHARAHDHHGHDHHSQQKTQHAEDVKHLANENKPEAEEHAAFNPHHYSVRLYSPFTNADHGAVGVPKGAFTPVKAGCEWTPESLNHHLKEEWYKDHVGCFVFESEKTFDAHVLALLTE